MSTILPKDTDLNFPHFTVLKASAGSGKTYALTKRFVQFLLTGKISRNNLRNMLAVTFTNNAAKEMKERMLTWLKDVYLNEQEAVEGLSSIVHIDKEGLQKKAACLLDEILENYSDFQVRTIDSFMAAVFKASSIDFGYDPDFEILMNKDRFTDYAFDLFLKRVRGGSREAEFIEAVVDSIGFNRGKDQSFLWNPSSKILDEIKGIYGKLASHGKSPKIEEFEGELRRIKEEISKTVNTIEEEIVSTDLDRNGGSSYKTVLPLVRDKKFNDLMGKTFVRKPVNIIKTKEPSKQAAYNRISDLWDETAELVKQYTGFHIRSFYAPYLKAYKEFIEVLEDVKKKQGKVFIDDINNILAGYLGNDIIPDVYFRLGETIFHFFVDEFQDTSPIQWKNLFPLMENSLSQYGSVFIVGDTKQAIYRFRNADYTIMKNCEAGNPFPSAAYKVLELDTNRRSDQRILDFNEKIFKDIVPDTSDYKEAAERSGLTDYTQHVMPGRDNRGYVEVTLYELDENNPPEKQKLQAVISELHDRGYNYRDMAVLTQKNEDAVRATAWLNEKNIRFISLSSLDIRRRKITGEVIALVNFLDSPTDDLSFATFILGDIFTGMLGKHYPDMDGEKLRIFIFRSRSGSSPLYKSFQKEFGGLWEDYFKDLFRSTGYLPLYDLVTEIFTVFRVFETFRDEEAVFVKILETVKDFEGEGYNSLRDFIEFADDEGSESEWDMNVPKDMDAVQVMTIHKSKGLGFPVVIALLYEARPKPANCIADTEGDNETVRFLRINSDTQQCGPEFKELYDEEKIKDRVDSLNGLYVALTRAKEELYVIGARKQNKKNGKEEFPFDLLPADDYPPATKPSPKTVLGKDAPHIDLPHHSKRLQLDGYSPDVLTVEERRRGEFIHSVLSRIEYTDDAADRKLSEIISAINIRSGTSYPENEVRTAIKGILENRELREYFMRRPGREIRNEQEFVNARGELFRMDRVVIDTSRVTIVDYKTGSDKGWSNKHMEQMRTYIEIIKAIYPSKESEGILVYIDSGMIRRMS